MEGMLKFNLPEEDEEFRNAQNGGWWRAVCQHMDEWLRGQIKHGHTYKTAGEALQACRDELRAQADRGDASLD